MKACYLLRLLIQRGVSCSAGGENNLNCNFGGIGLGDDGENIKLTTIDNMNLCDIGYIHCDAQGSENFIFSKGIETIKLEKLKMNIVNT